MRAIQDPALISQIYEGGSFYGGSIMKFTLEATKSKYYYKSYVLVYVNSESSVQVGIKTSKVGLKVNRNNMVIFSALAYSNEPYNLKYLWRCDQNLSIDSYASSLTEKYLKIKPYVLDENMRYMFTCQVTDIDGTVGDAIVRVTVNRAPRPGKFIITPDSGIQGITQFELKADGWSDNDLPLTYLFSYNDQKTGIYMPIAPRSEKSTALSTFIMPNSNYVQLKLEVFDGLNATTEVYQTINLYASNVTSDDLLKKATDATNDTNEKLNFLSNAVQVMDCNSNDARNCQKTVDLLDEIERKLPAHSVESDYKILGILSNVINEPQHAKLETVLEILTRVGNRENENIKKSLSIFDEQFDNKRIQYGLAQPGTTFMADVLGKTVQQMNDMQVFQQKHNIANLADIVSRSFIKDNVPNEKPLEFRTEAFSVFAQKISYCGETTGNITAGSLDNVGYRIPICDIVNANKTQRYENKTLNQHKPYDVIIQVFERNIVGDCSPLPAKLLRVVLYDDYEKVQRSVKDVMAGINFTFNLDGNYTDIELSRIQCVYFENDGEEFTPRTLRTALVNDTRKEFMCTSSHLTEFTLMYLPYEINKKSIISPESEILCAIMFLCLMMHILARILDKKDQPDQTTLLEGKTEKIRAMLIQNELTSKNTTTRPIPNLNVSTYMPNDQSNLSLNASVNITGIEPTSPAILPVNYIIPKNTKEDISPSKTEASPSKLAQNIVVQKETSVPTVQPLTCRIIAKIILVFFINLTY